jgi:hypothetical protein
MGLFAWVRGYYLEQVMPGYWFFLNFYLMELTVKNIFLAFIWSFVAGICLAAPYVHAETGVDIEEIYDVDTEPATESMTVDVTRTNEGVVVVTPDGRRVLLRNDHTWEVIEGRQGDPSTSAIISVANITELRNACKIGLRLENRLGYSIKSLIPSFSVYTGDGLLFETVSKSFSSIKPTRDQYRQIQFIGITCDKIGHVRVHGADHCSMGQMDKFNEAEGECLSHIYVQASDLVKITK